MSRLPFGYELSCLYAYGLLLLRLWLLQFVQDLPWQFTEPLSNLSWPITRHTPLSKLPLSALTGVLRKGGCHLVA